VLPQRCLATHAQPVMGGGGRSAIAPPYPQLLRNLEHVRNAFRRPLTLAEKILYSHLIDPERSLGNGNIRGQGYLQLRPERVAMQDASAQ
jgi:homoaconitase